MGTIEKKSLNRGGAAMMTRRPTTKVPLVVLLVIGASLFAGTVYLFYTVFKTAFAVPAPYEDYYQRLDELQQELDPSWSPIVQLGATSCPIVQQRVQEGHWHDPNGGHVFARTLITEPIFTIAVHNQTYDPVRWDTLFVQGKYYEDLVFARFVKILGSQMKQQRKALVLDVGANIGFYTLLSATMGYPVVSFEINPANLVRLCESLRLNNHNHHHYHHPTSHHPFPAVAIFQKGVSNVDGTPLQVLVPKNPGQAFLREINDQQGLDKLKLTNDTSTHHAFTTTVTLDAFGTQLGWLKGGATNNAASDWTIAILKLDVEGKEPQIIEGAKELLNSGRVLNVLTEFRRLARPNIQEAIQTLLDAGYGLVDDDEEGKPGKRMNRKESQALLDGLTKKYKGSGRNFDLWFQRAAS